MAARAAVVRAPAAVDLGYAHPPHVPVMLLVWQPTWNGGKITGQDGPPTTQLTDVADRRSRACVLQVAVTSVHYELTELKVKRRTSSRACTAPMPSPGRAQINYSCHHYFKVSSNLI